MKKIVFSYILCYLKRFVFSYIYVVYEYICILIALMVCVLHVFV